MHAIRLGAVAVALCAVAGAATAQEKSGFDLDEHRRVLPPVSFENLVLMPIVSTGVAKGAIGADYLVLDEGMKKGLVKVVEKEGGDVNHLVLTNSSKQPLFLLAGEVIIGGKQDRIIGKDTIIPARKTEAVPVFCVEHGRWSGRKASFESAGALAHTKLRKQAKYAGQSEVWKEVADKNSRLKTTNGTDTYRRIATGKKVASSVAAYRKQFARALGRLPERKQIVGFVVVVNGKVAAIESFGSPALYRKLERKLLESYYVEAVNLPPAKDAKPAGKTAVKKFVAAAAKARAKRQKSADTEAAETYDYSGDEVEGSTVRAKRAPAAAQPVYDSVYSNE